MKEHNWITVTTLEDDQPEWKCEDCGRHVQSTTEMVAADREGCEPEEEAASE